MNDDASRRAQLRRLFELVGPPSVIRHGLAAECLGVKFRGVGWVGHGRIIDEHNDHFALDVHAFKIVPLKFRRLNAVAHENHIGVYGRRIRNALGPRDVVVLKFRLDDPAVARQRHLHAFVRSDSN